MTGTLRDLWTITWKMFLVPAAIILPLNHCLSKQQKEYLDKQQVECIEQGGQYLRNERQPAKGGCIFSTKPL